MCQLRFGLTSSSWLPMVKVPARHQTRRVDRLPASNPPDLPPLERTPSLVRLTIPLPRFPDGDTSDLPAAKDLHPPAPGQYVNPCIRSTPRTSSQSLPPSDRNSVSTAPTFANPNTAIATSPVRINTMLQRRIPYDIHDPVAVRMPIDTGPWAIPADTTGSTQKYATYFVRPVELALIASHGAMQTQGLIDVRRSIRILPRLQRMAIEWKTSGWIPSILRGSGVPRDSHGTLSHFSSSSGLQPSSGSRRRQSWTSDQTPRHFTEILFLTDGLYSGRSAQGRGCRSLGRLDAHQRTDAHGAG